MEKYNFVKNFFVNLFDYESNRWFTFFKIVSLTLAVLAILVFFISLFEEEADEYTVLFFFLSIMSFVSLMLFLKFYKSVILIRHNSYLMRKDDEISLIIQELKKINENLEKNSNNIKNIENANTKEMKQSNDFKNVSIESEDKNLIEIEEMKQSNDFKNVSIESEDKNLIEIEEMKQSNDFKNVSIESEDKKLIEIKEMKQSNDFNTEHVKPRNKNYDLIIDSNESEIEPYKYKGDQFIISVYFPISIRKIGIQAFSKCDNLKNIYFEGSSEEWKNVYMADFNTALKQAKIEFNVKIHEKMLPTHK